MPTTFIGSNGGTGTSVTVATHQAGDLIVMYVMYTSSLTPPAGWTFVASGPYSTIQTAVYYKFATGTSDTSGLWTGASILASFVYRQAAPGGIPTAATANGSSASVAFPELTGHSAYLRVAYPGTGTTPSGWTSRATSLVQSVDALAVTGAASTVGGNAASISSQAWVAWTIGISPAAAGNSNAFFQFF